MLHTLLAGLLGQLDASGVGCAPTDGVVSDHPALARPIEGHTHL
ncbi:MAG: hypothetical protein ACI9MC_001357, partial [Kiritimatiellia bacterium]